MARSSDVEKIYVEILNGTAKANSAVAMDSELLDLWDSIEAEVTQMRAEGKQFEIPTEIPEVEPVPDSPAKTIRSKLLAAELEDLDDTSGM